MSKRRIGSFEVEQQLGAGGMGIVYLATYVKTGQKVALKVLSPNLVSDPKLLARFNRETDILKRLRHPNIVRYYGGGEQDGQRYYAMELIDGGGLDQYVKKRGGTLSWEQVIEVGKQVCAALEHAHNAGIVHRDLKPANLFLTRKGKLKLGDFGIARDTEATALTAAGKTVGTYAYMAPEQIVGKPEVSRKTDLYALGCVLYELLAGEPPFVCDTPAEMLFAHIEQEAPSVREKAIDCPIWLDQLIARLLEKDPEDRPYDALAVQTELAEIPDKVAAQKSVASETVAGSMTVSSKDRSELKKVLGKKKKKKKRKDHVPLHEQTWVLATGLLALVGVVTWLAWPLSEEAIHARVKEAMASTDESVREQAHEKYIVPYLADHPEGQFIVEMTAWDEQVRVDRLRRQLQLAMSLNRAPENEAERWYMEARKYEAVGDRLAALDKYRGLIKLLSRDEDEESALFVLLAEEQIEAIEREGSGGGDRFEFVNEKLRQADALRDEGKPIEAEEIWRIIEKTYGDNREFALHVRYARARLNGEEPPELDLSAQNESSE